MLIIAKIGDVGMARNLCNTKRGKKLLKSAEKYSDF